MTNWSVKQTSSNKNDAKKQDFFNYQKSLFFSIILTAQIVVKEKMKIILNFKEIFLIKKTDSNSNHKNGIHSSLTGNFQSETTDAGALVCLLFCFLLLCPLFIITIKSFFRRTMSNCPFVFYKWSMLSWTACFWYFSEFFFACFAKKVVKKGLSFDSLKETTLKSFGRIKIIGNWWIYKNRTGLSWKNESNSSF